MRGPLFPGPGLGTRGSGLAGPRLPRRSQNESVRRWRLLGAPACGFLPNGLASTSRRCNGSAALSRPSSPVSKEAVGRAAAGAAAPWAAPPHLFAQTYRRSTRPGRVSVNAGLQILTPSTRIKICSAPSASSLVKTPRAWLGSFCGRSRATDLIAGSNIRIWGLCSERGRPTDRPKETPPRCAVAGFWQAQMLNASSAIIPIPVTSTANATGS
jgi:hypothetical protein